MSLRIGSSRQFHMGEVYKGLGKLSFRGQISPLRQFHCRYHSEALHQLNSNFTDPITVNGAPV